MLGKFNPRYEAASTIFGPNTLNAYLEQYEMLMGTMLSGGSVSPGPSPPDLLDDQVIMIITKVIIESDIVTNRKM